MVAVGKCRVLRKPGLAAQVSFQGHDDSTIASSTVRILQNYPSALGLLRGCTNTDNWLDTCSVVFAILTFTSLKNSLESFL
jgi:hypothetical protein